MLYFEVNPSFAVGNVQKLRAPIAGTVTYVVSIKVGDEVVDGQHLLTVKPCQHTVVMKDMCAHCGTNLRV